MSIHSSLRQAGGKIGTVRNVLKRHERVRVLMAQGRWNDPQTALGLPKLRPEKRKIKKSAPKEAKAAEGAEASAATPAK